MGKLIVVACGAGINTSTVAEVMIRERLDEEGMDDVEVKRILIADIDKYVDRMDLVVCMMKIYREFDVPQLKGMPFLIGTKAEKKEVLDGIIELVKD
ncbi:MAG: PTS galactitol transporter subunit IIB [Chloroflexi bacterium]|nr:PTS galactitol transporter subunit IIB [Chloroflexota bacterium]